MLPILYCILAFGSPHTAEPPTWVAAALKTKAAVSILKEIKAEKLRADANRSGRVFRVAPGGGGGIDMVTGKREPPDERPDEFMIKLNRTIYTIADLWAQRKYQQAYRVCKRACEEDDLGSFDGMLFESQALSGRKQEMYRTAVEDTQSDNANEYSFLQLSLASSLRGEVYPGQLQYCVNNIQSQGANSGWEIPPILVQEYKDGTSRREVAVVSYLALAGGTNQQARLFYLEAALRLDPKNGYLAGLLVKDYVRLSQFASAYRLAKRWASKAPSETVRADMERVLREDAGRKDLPMRVRNPRDPEPNRP